MARFLSAQWLAELDAAARRAPGEQLPPSEVRLVVQQVVDPGSEDEVAWTVRVADGRLRVEPGRDDDADVVIEQDRATATAIARGEQSAQAAFMTGRLQVRGDLQAMMANQSVMACVDEVLAPVRSGTSFG